MSASGLAGFDRGARDSPSLSDRCAPRQTDQRGIATNQLGTVRLRRNRNNRTAAAPSACANFSARLPDPLSGLDHDHKHPRLMPNERRRRSTRLPPKRGESACSRPSITSAPGSTREYRPPCAAAHAVQCPAHVVSPKLGSPRAPGAACKAQRVDETRLFDPFGVHRRARGALAIWPAFRLNLRQPILNHLGKASHDSAKLRGGARLSPVCTRHPACGARILPFLAILCVPRPHARPGEQRIGHRKELWRSCMRGSSPAANAERPGNRVQPARPVPARGRSARVGTTHDQSPPAQIRIALACPEQLQHGVERAALALVRISMPRIDGYPRRLHCLRGVLHLGRLDIENARVGVESAGSPTAATRVDLGRSARHPQISAASSETVGAASFETSGSRRQSTPIAAFREPRRPRRVPQFAPPPAG